MKPGPDADADARGIAKGELKVSVVFLFMILEEIHNQHRFKFLHFYKNVCYPAKDIYCNTLNSRHVNNVTQVSNGWILTIIFINWLYKNIVRFIFIIK